MTEEAYTPTFSHQPTPPAASPTGTNEALSSVLAGFRGAVIDGAAAQREARDARTGALRAVWDSLPDNVRAPRSELEQRVGSERLKQLAGAWWYDQPNLLALGPTGAGKTSALALIVRRLLEEAVRSPRDLSPVERKHWRGCRNTVELAGLIRWQSCRELSEAMKEFALGQGMPEAVARCQHARLLVLDDIGATDNPTALERILNARYERGWPTLSCSGLTSRGLSERFGEALARRLLQRKGQNGSVVSLFARGEA